MSDWSLKLWKHRNDKRPYWVITHVCGGLTPVIRYKDSTFDMVPPNTDCLQCGRHIPYSIVSEMICKNEKLSKVLKLQGIYG